jgi:hypothetical protein
MKPPLVGRIAGQAAKRERRMGRIQAAIFRLINGKVVDRSEPKV